MTKSSLNLTPQIIDYIVSSNPPEHEVLERCRIETEAIPRAQMQISPEQGAFMSFLIRLIDARIAIEVGVFTGYSALVTSLALRANAGPGAKLFALDISHKYMQKAQEYWQAADVNNYIVPRIGPAAQSLEALIDEGYAGRVDFIFIDADKVGYLNYLVLAKRLLRPGGIMLFDNVLRGGEVANPLALDDATVAMRKLIPLAHEDANYDTCMVGVGDGLLMMRKKS